MLNNNIDKIKISVVELLKENNAQDVLICKTVNSIASYHIFISGISQRHVRSLAQKTMQYLKSCDLKVFAEGMKESNWILLDSGEIIVHVFLPDVRTYYNIDALYT